MAKNLSAPPSPPRSASRFERALELHRAGQTDAAEELYENLLRDLPAALSNLGVIKRQKGEVAEGVRLQRLALHISPKQKGFQKNLINALLELNRYGEAEAALLAASEDHPDEESFLWQLARLRARYRSTEKLRGAVDVFRRLLDRNPDDLTAANNLADCLIRLDRPDEAIAVLQPHQETPEIGFKLSVLRGETVARTPADYVQEHFDRFAPRFEKRLVGDLNYRGPDLLMAMLLEESGEPPHFASALDLGCGTGLFGERLQPYCESITGIDLSPKMLEVAAQKNVYTRLETADIAAFLTENAETYDLIIAADVFVYVGDLAPVFSLVAQRLNPGAPFLFSTEHTEDGEFIALASGRFKHSDAYLKRLAANAGLTVEAAKQEPFREEFDDKVLGGFYRLRRP